MMGRSGLRTTTFRLVRHGAHEEGDDVLVGRKAGIALSQAGRRQIEELAGADWVRGLDLIQSSPRQRTQETAAILGEAAGREHVPSAAIDEVDFGSWSGRQLAELDDDPRWRLWNTRRQHAATPAGVTYRDLQWRVWRHLSGLSRRYPGYSVAIVTHAEIIRVSLLAARGLPLCDWRRIDVPLASVHVLRLTAASGRGGEVDRGAAP